MNNLNRKCKSQCEIHTMQSVLHDEIYTMPLGQSVLHDELMNMKIPVRITHRSTPINILKNKGHNKANCIQINISASSANISKSWLPSLLLTNICHVLNKVDELSVVVEQNKPSLVMVTESWLRSTIPDSAVNIGSNFASYRRDRPTSGGGLLAYVHKSIPTTRLQNLEESDKEVIWLQLKPARTPRPFSCILLVGVYYPPGQTVEAEKEMLDYLLHGLDLFLRDYPSAGMIIAGDFNKLNLSSLCRQFNLRKSVKAPTRGRNVLDQILTNMYDSYNHVQHLPPIGRSDHQTLLLKPKIKEKIKPIVRRIRQMKPENIRSLGLKLNLESWDEVFNASNVDAKVNIFTSTLNNLLDQCLPECSIKVHPSEKPWLTPQIKREIKARQQAYAREDLVEYKGRCKKVSSLVSKAKLRYYKSKVEDVKHYDQSKWYKTVYKLAAAEESGGTTLLPETVSDITERLQSAFIKPWQDIEPTKVPDIDEVVSLLKDHTPATPSIGQIKSSLKHVNSRKATGVDGIPAWLLNRFHEELSLVVLKSASSQHCISMPLSPQFLK